MVHDLRSALEHVAWVLAASNTNDIESLWEPSTRRQITFPVATAPDAFDRHTLLPFVSDQARVVLDQFQPHHRGHPAQASRQPLAVLNELWNIDKHCVVHGGVGQIDLSRTSWVPKAMIVDELKGRLQIETIERAGPLEDGAAIAYVRFPGVTDPPGTKG